MRGRNGDGRTPRRARPAGAAVILALLLAASCSDGSDGSEPTSTTRSSVPEGSAETGTINDTPSVPSRAIAEPVAIDGTADFGEGVTARLSSVEAVDAQARIPGEVSGPGVVITLEVTNGSSAPIGLDNVTVDLVDAQDRSASPITMEGRTPLSGDLEPGAKASGTYVFTMPVEDRATAEVRVTYAAPPTPTVVFAGNLNDA
jgi:hypothetical protein